MDHAETDTNRAQDAWNQQMRTADYSPEKAGVGGSTPSLATTFQTAYKIGLHQSCASASKTASNSTTLFAVLSEPFTEVFDLIHTQLRNRRVIVYARLGYSLSHLYGLSAAEHNRWSELPFTNTEVKGNHVSITGKYRSNPAIFREAEITASVLSHHCTVKVLNLSTTRRCDSGTNCW